MRCFEYVRSGWCHAFYFNFWADAGSFPSLDFSFRTCRRWIGGRGWLKDSNIVLEHYQLIDIVSVKCFPEQHSIVFVYLFFFVFHIVYTKLVSAALTITFFLVMQSSISDLFD